MIWSFLSVAPKFWQRGMHERKSDRISFNHKILYATYKWCFLFNEGFNQLINVFRNWGIEVSAEGNLKRDSFNWVAEEKKKTLQRIPIVFHAVLAFPRETSRYQRLFLVPHFGFQSRNQEVEEVQEHEYPSACRKTIVSLRPRTQIRKRRKYL